MALPFNFFQRQQQPAAAPAYNPFQALVQRQAQRQAAQSASFAERQAAQQAAFAQQAKGFGAGAPQQRSPISTMPVIGQTPMPQPGLQPSSVPSMAELRDRSIQELRQQQMPMPQRQMPINQGQNDLQLEMMLKQQQGLGQPPSLSSMAEQAQMEAARARMLAAVQGPQALQPQMPQQQSPGMAIQFDQLRQQLTSNPYVQQQSQLQQQMDALQQNAFSAAGINPAGIFSPEDRVRAAAVMQQLQSSPQLQALQQQQQQLSQQMRNDPSFMSMNQQYEQLGQQLNQAEALRQQQFQTSTVMGPQDFLAQKQIAQPLSASTMAEQASLQAARARMLGGGQGLVPQPQGPQALQPTQSAMLGNMAQNFPGTLGQAPAQGGLGNFMPQRPDLLAMTQQAQRASQPMIQQAQLMGAQQAQPQVMGLRQGFNMAGPQAMQTLGGAPRQASQPPRLGGI